MKAFCKRKPSADAASADAIVVLSGGRHPAPGTAKVSEWHDPDRFFAALELFSEGKALRLLLTRGRFQSSKPNPATGEAASLVEAQQLGIPATAMQSTPSVLSAAQEGIAIHQLWQASDRSSSNPRILLVTSAFHMRRTQRLFERQGLTVASFPVDSQAHGHWA